MNYYIADLHLFHKNVTKAGINFDDRPYDDIPQMHEDILNRWNKKITNGDTVYILGDVSLSHPDVEESASWDDPSVRTRAYVRRILVLYQVPEIPEKRKLSG